MNFLKAITGSKKKKESSGKKTQPAFSLGDDDDEEEVKEVPTQAKVMGEVMESSSSEEED